MSGLLVRFEVTGGGSVENPQTHTDEAGVASPGTWTLGVSAGTQELKATAAGLPPIRFKARAKAGRTGRVVAIEGNGQTAVAGTVVPIAPAVRVEDSFGNPVPDMVVTFQPNRNDGSVTGGTATTDARGVAAVGSWTLGTKEGNNRLKATVDAKQVQGNPVTFTATGTAATPPPPVPTTVKSVAGDGQSAEVGTALPVAPAVRVDDAGGNPMAGVQVEFTISAGGGSITGGSATTDASGIATVGSWTLGPVAGANELTATVQASGVAGNPVTFAATGTAPPPPPPPPPGPGWDVDIRYNAGSTPTAGQQLAFDSAEARWESLITGDLEDVVVNRSAGTCGSSSAINETVDDLVIFVSIETIDGPGGILGSAGPCMIRSGSNLPILGRMRFDIADLASLESNGRLEDVILHEMGHIIGVGTLWSAFGLLIDPTTSGGTDPHFIGAETILAFDAAGGAGYTGAKVPVEDQGGPGTANGHWRESIFRNELMTGFLNSGSNPASAITIASLFDMGYVVNPGGADPYTLPGPIALRADDERIEMIGDVFTGPVEAVDRAGRRVRLITIH